MTEFLNYNQTIQIIQAT